MHQVRTVPLVPGSVLQVWSKQYGVYHKGVVDWPDLYGNPRVIHSPKGSAVRSTSLEEFAEGRAPEVLWIPQNAWQQSAMIERIRSLVGLRHDLLNANCEHVVNWALTGKWHSQQLAAAGAMAALVLVAVTVKLLST